MSSFALEHPLIIQGGMGVGVSNWTLARAVSSRGQLGVVSGTGIDAVFVRRLQDGDIGGHIRRAVDAFPFQDIAAEVMSKYFRPEGREPGEPYKGLPLYRQVVTKARDQITVLGSFAEVWLAKEGHGGVVGMNLLTKVQMPNLATLYGAMLAGVDYVLMGAGIPREIPGALDRLAELEPAKLKLDVENAGRDSSHELVFRPKDHPDPGGPLKRPLFLPIISSNSLATVLVKKATGKVNGFIVEAPIAGGHNAPPRGKLQLNERGEPVYGERDMVNLEQLKELGLPFWLAGGSGSPAKFQEARAAGAAGIQVGTLFAYCDEAGFSDEVKETVRRQALNGRLDVVTDAVASPTGFPFKVVQSKGTLSDRIMYEQRERVCDLGYLRVAYERDDGRLDYRCSAEPVETFVKKGGQREATEGRKCLCNALFSAIGQPQVRKDGRVEQPLLTSGDEINSIRHLVGDNGTGYSAADVIDYLLGES
jgi:NAD(P)H-dependent flavin oxidoreductase YrpB (nitropropane dioxygenase family)